MPHTASNIRVSAVGEQADEADHLDP